MDILINERKFTAHRMDQDRALTLVSHFCIPHPLYPLGRVNSIYFDTPRLDTFTEKFEGDTLKRKYRLRWYDVPDEDPRATLQAFLEVKYRFGSARDKLRIPLELDRAWLRNALHSESVWLQLLQRIRQNAEDNFPVDLRPALRVSYLRHRFDCPTSGYGVCVDTDIRGDHINPNLFPSTIPVELPTLVCEVKGPHFHDVPWFLNLYDAGFRLRSFSKYGECVNRILHDGAPTVIPMSI